MIDPYVSGDSQIHHLDPRVKLPIALGFILTISALYPKAYPIYLLVFFIIISFQVMSQISVIHFIKRTLIFSPFLLAVIPLPFISGEPVKYIHIFSMSIPVSVPGVERMINVVIKSMLSLQVAILLVSTTDFNGLLAAMKFLHIPKMLVQVYGMMWRYLFVITEEVNSIISARNARSASTPYFHSGGNIFWRAKIAGNMMGSLLIRSLERSERIYNAMLSRGYDGDPRAITLENPLTRTEKVILFSILFCLIILLVSGLIFQ